MAEYGTPIPPIEETQKKSKPWIIIAVVLVILCCCCLIFSSGLGWLWTNGDALIQEFGYQVIHLFA